jgi:uncharacterized protein YndB with AHSA1/START domain
VRLCIEDTQEVELRGEVVECDPPRRLTYTWNCQDGPATETPRGISTVTFELQPMGGSVRLTVTHAPLAEDDGARQGWPAILSSLKSYLETGAPISATERWRQRVA